MKKTKIILLTLLSILLLCACNLKKSTSNVSENISQAASEISKETTTEGKTITTLADGTIIEKSNDGTSIEISSDGTTKEIKADGTIIETELDGMITETKVDGTVILFKTDGSKLETAPDGSTKEIQSAIQAPTVAPIEVAAQSPTEAPTVAVTDTPIVVAPTEAHTATPIVVAPTQAPTEAPTQVSTQAPTYSRYVLTTAETFLTQGGWSLPGMGTELNVYEQLCVIGEGLANGVYTETQAIEKIKQIKDSTDSGWVAYGSYAQIITAPGKLDCSTMALKHALLVPLDDNIGFNQGENKYMRVFYIPNADTTIIYFVSVSGTNFSKIPS